MNLLIEFLGNDEFTIYNLQRSAFNSIYNSSEKFTRVLNIYL